MTAPIKYVFDGELYNHSLDFNIISSLVNSEAYDEVEDKAIQFHMYDFIDMSNKEQAFPDRLDSVWNDVEEGSNPFSYIKLVDQTLIHSEEELKTIFTSHIAGGYEGTMLKDQSPYAFGKRSNSLLKYKEMETDEFKVKRVFLAPNDVTKVQIEFYTDFFRNPESTFEVGTVKGNKEENLEKYYTNKESVEGKWMTVQYQTWSTTDDPKPLFGVAIGIREGKEVNGEFIPDV